MHSTAQPIQEAVSIIRNLGTQKPLRIILPLSVEGLISATFLTKTLTELNTKFALSFLSNITEDSLKNLSRENYYGAYLFVGIEPEHLKHVEKLGKEKPFISIYPTSSKISGIHIYAEDVFQDSIILTYSLCRELYPEIKSLSYLLLISRENAPEAIFNEAQDYITIKEGLTLFNSPTRPLHKALEYSYKPYIQGITGNEQAAINLLAELNIPLKRADGQYKRLIDLSHEELKMLVTPILINRLGNEETSEKLYGNILLLTHEEEDSPFKALREYELLLNCCVVLNKPTLAMGTCLGNPSSKREALQVLTTYNRDIINALTWFVTNRKTNLVQEHRGYVIITTEEQVSPILLPTLTTLIKKTNLYPETLLMIIGHALEELNIILTSTHHHTLEELETILKTITKKIGDYYLSTNHTSCSVLIPLEKEGELLKNAHEILAHYALEEAVAVKKPL